MCLQSTMLQLQRYVPQPIDLRRSWVSPFGVGCWLRTDSSCELFVGDGTFSWRWRVLAGHGARRARQPRTSLCDEREQRPRRGQNNRWGPRKKKGSGFQPSPTALFLEEQVVGRFFRTSCSNADHLLESGPLKVLVVSRVCVCMLGRAALQL